MRSRIILTIVINFSISFLLQAQHPGAIKWTFQTGDKITDSPALGTDGIIYIHSSDENLYAINPDGSLKWSFTKPPYTTDYWRHTSICIAPNSNIYCGGYIINTSGNNLSNFQWGSPAIDSSGHIYSIGYGGLHAFNSDGLRLWRWGGNHYGYPVISKDGIIYVQECNERDYVYSYYLKATNSDGNSLWTHYAGTGGMTAPVISSNGTLYFGAGNNLCSLNPNGILNWSFTTGDKVNAPPIITREGYICVGSYDHKIYMIDPLGYEKWSFLTDGPIYTSPVIGIDKTIYIGSENKIYAISSNGNELWSFATGGSLHSSPTIAPDGMLYIGSDDGKVYAVQTQSMGLADTPWPKYKNNLQNNAVASSTKAPMAIVAEDTIHTKTNQMYVLDASLSTDPDGDPLSFLWRCIEKPEGSSVTIADSTNAVTQISCSKEGRYKFGVLVSDHEDGASAKIVFIHCLDKLKWLFKTGRKIYSDPAIGPDSTIYIGSDKLYAINPNGSEKWTYNTGKTVNSPTIGIDSTIYIISGNKLYAINLDGLKKWGFQVENHSPGLPAIASDGTIYISFNNGNLYAIDSGGSEKWVFTTSNNRAATPTILSDGTIYYSGYVIYPDGKMKSKYDFSSPVVVGGDGTLYTETHAYNTDGTLKWSLPFDVTLCSGEPVIGPDGTIYLGTFPNYAYPSTYQLYAINSDGTVKWSFNTKRNICCTPVIGADSTMYFSSYETKLYALNFDGTEKWSFNTDDRVISSPTLNKDGVLFFGSNDKKLYAIQTNSHGLADAPWPKYRKDVCNTGNGLNNNNNNWPVANIESDTIYANANESITLNGSSSYDPGGDDLTYLWTCIEKPDGSTISISDSCLSIVQVTCSRIGYYRFNLTVYNSKGYKSSQSVWILCQIKWFIQLRSASSSTSWLPSAPGLASDGTIYVASNFGLYAINPDGSKKWRLNLSGWLECAPTITMSGTIYVGSSDKLYALTPDGQEKWSFATGNNVQSSPAVGSDGTIYFGSRDYNLYAIDPDGIKKMVFHNWWANC